MVGLQPEMKTKIFSALRDLGIIRKTLVMREQRELFNELLSLGVIDDYTYQKKISKLAEDIGIKEKSVFSK